MKMNPLKSMGKGPKFPSAWTTWSTRDTTLWRVSLAIRVTSKWERCLMKSTKTRNRKKRKSPRKNRRFLRKRKSRSLRRSLNRQGLIIWGRKRKRRDSLRRWKLNLAMNKSLEMPAISSNYSTCPSTNASHMPKCTPDFQRKSSWTTSYLILSPSMRKNDLWSRSNP